VNVYLLFKALDRAFSGFVEEKYTSRPNKGDMIHLEG
jgi:hypothetical protein